jgi:hypothetical protein
LPVEFLHSTKTMHIPQVLLATLLLLSSCVNAKADQNTTLQWPIHNNGLNKVIEWYASSQPISRNIRLTSVKGSLQLHHQWTKALYLWWRGRVSRLEVHLSQSTNIHSFIIGDFQCPNCGKICFLRSRLQDSTLFRSTPIGHTTLLPLPLWTSRVAPVILLPFLN